MKRLRLSLKTISPVIEITESSDGNTVSSLDYLPGSSLLGAFANRYRFLSAQKENLHLQENFRQWFLNQDFRFLNAYPCVDTPSGKERAQVAPLMLHKTKGNDVSSFFLPEIEAIERLTLNSKSVGGFVHFYLKEGLIDSYDTIRTVNNSAFHNSRSDYRQGCNDEGNIFHYESIPSGREFISYICGEEELLNQFRAFFGESTMLRIGKSKYTQYGKVGVKWENVEDVPFSAPVNKELRNRWHVVFQSPVMMRNQNGFTISDTDTFSAIFQEGFRIVDRAVRIRSVESFVNTWRCKKPSLVAFDKGSTITLDTSKATDDQKKALLRTLQEGIGLHKNWGFGEVSVLPPIKGELSSCPSEKDNRVDKKPVPPSILPLITEIVENQLVKAIENYAFRKAKEVKRIPTNHLLSRLRGIIEYSEKIEDIRVSLSSLKSAAKEQLEKCTIKDGKNLYESIKSLPQNIGNFLSEGVPDLRTFYDSEMKNRSVEEDEKFRYHKLYLLSLIRFLRLKNKQAEKEGGLG
ncbi:MAG: hypothetical protein KBC39_10775 [Thermotogae bacterium]|nr:hypothetical protein [Thermotogota bacterium]HPH11533.1 hypothetical protein [Thermotogota bacterium]